MFVVSDCTAALELRFVDDSVPVAIRTGDVAPVPAATPPAWTVEWDKPGIVDRELGTYASTGHLRGGCPQGGVYRLPLTIVGADRETARLDVTLARVFEPALAAPSTVTLEVDRLFGMPGPAAFEVRETAPSVAPVALAVAGGALVTTGGVSTGIVLEPQAAALSIKAGGIGEVLLTPSRAPPPGAYTTKLMLHSAALPRDTAVDVIYRVRLSAWVLLGVIVAGILLGLLVNGVLAARAALEAALLAALRVMDEVARRAGPQRDPAVQQRLIAVATHLRVQLREAAAPKEMEDAAQAAQVEAKRIEEAAATDLANLQQVLTANRAIFRPDGGPLDPVLAGRLAGPAGAIDTLQRAADAGEVTETRARLQDFVGGLRQTVLPPLQAILADIEAGLDELGPLPAPVESIRLTLRERASDAYGERDPGTAVAKTEDVVERLRLWMDRAVPGALADAWREAARRVGAQKPALAEQLMRAADGAEALRAPGRELMARLQALAAAAATVRGAMAEAIGAEDDAARDKLAAGDVEGAAQLMGGALLVGRFKPERPMATVAEVPADELPAPVAAAVLRVKPLLELGQSALVVLRWVGAAAPAKPSWRCDPANAAELKPVPAGLLVRPKSAGFLTLVVSVDGADAAEVSTYAGAVAAQSDFIGTARRKWWTDAAIAATTAVVTAAAGYEVLRPTWFGTVGDVFAAFSWGFFGQFGLDRVRALVKPLTAKPLP